MQATWSARAEREANAASAWWTENWPAAATLFDDELARVAEQVLAAPWSGVPYQKTRRRVLLRLTRYALIYKVEGDRIEFLSVWSTLRGRLPRLGNER
jgi:plasmid stabilization system protein ParE